MVIKNKFIFVLLGLLVAGFPARAEFTVCNQTLDVVNLSVGQNVEEVIQTEGWWTIGANRCVDVIREELNSRYVYNICYRCIWTASARG